MMVRPFTAGTGPDAIDLACPVNGYERHPDIAAIRP